MGAQLEYFNRSEADQGRRLWGKRTRALTNPKHLHEEWRTGVRETSPQGSSVSQGKQPCTQKCSKCCNWEKQV